MKDSFNSNFYIVASTVIPVFYIALVVQLPLIERMARSIHDFEDKLRRLPQTRGVVKSFIRWAASMAVGLGYFELFYVAGCSYSEPPTEK